MYLETKTVHGIGQPHSYWYHRLSNGELKLFSLFFPLRKDDTYKRKAIRINMMIFLQSRARSIWFPWRCSTNTEEAPSLSWKPPHWVRRNVNYNNYNVRSTPIVLYRGLPPCIWLEVLTSSRIYQKSEFFVIVHACSTMIDFQKKTFWPWLWKV